MITIKKQIVSGIKVKIIIQEPIEIVQEYISILNQSQFQPKDYQY